MMSSASNTPRELNMANTISDSSLLKRPSNGNGKPRLLPSPIFRSASPPRRSNKGHHHPARFSLWSCPAGGAAVGRSASARPASPILPQNNIMRDSDRGSSPSRLRCVTSMRELLPLQLGNSSGGSGGGSGGGRSSSATTTTIIRPTSKLRRSNSDPTTNGQLGRGPLTFNTSVEMSLTGVSTTPTFGGVKAQQALFDIGIFRPSMESHCSQTSSVVGEEAREEDKGGEIEGYSSELSPTDESRLSSVENENRYDDHVSDANNVGENSPLDDDDDQHDTASECSSTTSSQGMITIGALPECLLGSALGIRNVVPEPERLHQSPDELSWLEDASDDEDSRGLSRRLHLDETFLENRLEGVRNDQKVCNIQDTRIEYATAVSPSKATLIEVSSSKRSSTCSMEVLQQSSHTTSSTNITIPEEESSMVSVHNTTNFHHHEVPVTPPSSPQRTFLDMAGKKQKPEKRVVRVDTSSTSSPSSNRYTMEMKTKMKMKSMTPPQSPESMISSTGVMRDTTSVVDILDMIEQGIAGFPSVLIHVDSQLTSRIRGWYGIRSRDISSHHHSPPYSSSPETPLENTSPSTTKSVRGPSSSRGYCCGNSFRSIFDPTKTSDAIVSTIYIYILTLNFLDDLLGTNDSCGRLEQILHGTSDHGVPHRRQEPRRQKQQEINSATGPRIELSSKRSQMRIRCLRNGLRKCLQRLIEGVVGLDGNGNGNGSGMGGKNECFLRALGVVVRFEEDNIFGRRRGEGM